MTMPSLLIAAALAQAVAPPPPPPEDPALPLRVLPPQTLPATGCALFLWQQGPERRLLMMARTDNQSGRVMRTTGPVDLRAVSASGPALGGFAETMRFSDGALTLDWSLTIEQRADITDGAVVSAGMLTVSQTAGDAAAIPVTGLVGCATAG